MHKNCKQIRDIVNLWHDTVIGNMHKCREKHFEFSDMMWKLYEELKSEKE